MYVKFIKFKDENGLWYIKFSNMPPNIIKTNHYNYAIINTNLIHASSHIWYPPFLSFTLHIKTETKQRQTERGRERMVNQSNCESFGRKIMKEELKLIKRANTELLTLLCLCFLSCCLIWVSPLFGFPFSLSYIFCKSNPEKKNA